MNKPLNDARKHLGVDEVDKVEMNRGVPPRLEGRLAFRC